MNIRIFWVVKPRRHSESGWRSLLGLLDSGGETAWLVAMSVATSLSAAFNIPGSCWTPSATLSEPQVSPSMIPYMFAETGLNGFDYQNGGGSQLNFCTLISPPAFVSARTLEWTDNTCFMSSNFSPCLRFWRLLNESEWTAENCYTMCTFRNSLIQQSTVLVRTHAKLCEVSSAR